MRSIIANAKDPHRTFYWLLSETGIRLGEGCGLRVGSLKLDLEMVVIRWSARHGKVASTKSKKPRVFPISPQLADRLRAMIEPIKDNPNAFVFASRNGTPWIGDDVVRDHLKPLLLRLAIKTVPDGEDATGKPKFRVIDGVGTFIPKLSNMVGTQKRGHREVPSEHSSAWLADYLLAKLQMGILKTDRCRGGSRVVYRKSHQVVSVRSRWQWSPS